MVLLQTGKERGHFVRPVEMCRSCVSLKYAAIQYESLSTSAITRCPADAKLKRCNIPVADGVLRRWVGTKRFGISYP
jgi:hypothetical protein